MLDGMKSMINQITYIFLEYCTAAIFCQLLPSGGVSRAAGYLDKSADCNEMLLIWESFSGIDFFWNETLLEYISRKIATADSVDFFMYITDISKDKRRIVDMIVYTVYF